MGHRSGWPLAGKAGSPGMLCLHRWNSCSLLLQPCSGEAGESMSVSAGECAHVGTKGAMDVTPCSMRLCSCPYWQFCLQPELLLLRGSQNKLLLSWDCFYPGLCSSHPLSQPRDSELITTDKAHISLKELCDFL